MKKELLIGELQRITPDSIKENTYESLRDMKIDLLLQQNQFIISTMEHGDVDESSGFLSKLIGFIIISIFVSWCIAGYMGLGFNPVESLPKFLDVVISNFNKMDLSSE